VKAADLREKSAEDLQELSKTLARDVFQNRLKNFTNRLDDTSSIRKTRRDLARVVTLLRERELPRTTGTAAAAEIATKPAKQDVSAPATRPSSDPDEGQGTDVKKKKPSARAKKNEAKQP
jgi:large subunit ribosomal protein L29